MRSWPPRSISIAPCWTCSPTPCRSPAHWPPDHRSAPLPLLGEKLVGADPVGMVVGDGGDDQLVGAGRLLELLELVGDLLRGAGELGVHPVGDHGPVRVGPVVGPGLLRSRERDRALTGPDAA